MIIVRAIHREITVINILLSGAIDFGSLGSVNEIKHPNFGTEYW